MSSIATVPQAPVFPETIRVVPPMPARVLSWRKWLGASLVAVAISPAALGLPPVWHVAVRTFLRWQAARCGYGLTIAEITGGPFGATSLSGVRLRQSGTDPAGTGGTDLIVERARFAVAWRLPWPHRSASRVREMDLEGVHGQWDLTPESRPSESFRPDAASWLPANFVFRADDFCLRRGSYRLRASGLVLSGRQDDAGEIAAREVRAEAPGVTSTFVDWHGRTFWQGHRLTVVGLDLGHGISLASATLDASHINRRRLDWECALGALGGEFRGQGTVDFNHERAAVEIAATLSHTALAPFARMLGMRGDVDGQIERASFTFHGVPEDPSSAQMWLSARTTGVRWGDRCWQSLDTQALVVDRQVQVHRFDLRQEGNSLSLSGECPLPPADMTGLVWVGEGAWWRTAGFSCNVDARLEDLRALAGLIGPGGRGFAGRMSVNGRLTAPPGHPEIAGYLNVEGTRLTLRGAPLDFLRSTLLFRGGTLEVADVQATHDADYLTGHGVVGLCPARPERRGEVHAEIKDPGVYASALAGWPVLGAKAAGVRQLDAVLRLENGDLFFDRWEGEPTDFRLAR